jgi:hypothetical protein
MRDGGIWHKLPVAAYEIYAWPNEKIYDFE